MRHGIELDGVTRVVDGELHLADIHLKLEPGTFNVLLGRTRAGKTSLLRLMAGLDKPTSGTLRVSMPGEPLELQAEQAAARGRA